MNLDVNGLFGKLMDKSDLLFGIGGWFSEPSTSSIELSIGAIKDLFTGPYHLDAIGAPLQYRLMETAKMLGPLYIGAELAKALNLPFIGKYAGKIQSGIFTFALAQAAAIIIQYAAGDSHFDFPAGTPRASGGQSNVGYGY